MNIVFGTKAKRGAAAVAAATALALICGGASTWAGAEGLSVEYGATPNDAIEARGLEIGPDGRVTHKSKDRGIQVETSMTESTDGSDEGEGDADAPEEGSADTQGDGIQIKDPKIEVPGDSGKDGATQAEESKTEAADEAKKDDGIQIKAPKISVTEYTGAECPENGDRVYGYIGKDGKPAAVRGAKVGELNAETVGMVGSVGGWFAVKGDVTMNRRLEIAGTEAKILLCDGARLTVNGGIHVRPDATLEIYGQKEGTGELVADARETKNIAGIGGDDDEAAGTIRVCSGKVKAYGGEDAAGIGGGNQGHGGTIEIYGGDVYAEGKEYGAGIGGGEDGDGGTITIHGGKVSAVGGDWGSNGMTRGGGAGIGGGDEAAGGTIQILGGDVTARGTGTGAGIGGGSQGHSGNITLRDCTVHADGGDMGSGIGNGGHSFGCAQVTIENADVTACGKNGAGIGNGAAFFGAWCANPSSCKVYIRDSHVRCQSGEGAAIGHAAWTANGENEVAVEGHSVLELDSDTGASIGRGNTAGASYSGSECVGKLNLADDLRVISFSREEGVSDADRAAHRGGVIAPAAEREGYCFFRSHVRIEPCDHSHGQISSCKEGHTIGACPDCKAASGEVLAHDFDENKHCKTCGYDGWAPSFVKASPLTDGRMGVVFWYDCGRADGCDEDYVTLRVGGKNAREAKVMAADAIRRNALRGFAIELSAIEMAQEVTATAHWKEGDLEPVKASPLEGASDDRRPEDLGEAERMYGQALANYCYYTQRFLSVAGKWEIGRDYAAAKACFAELNDIDGARKALEQFKVVRQCDTRQVVKAVSMSVTSGSTVRAELVIQPKPGVELRDLHAFATKDGLRDLGVERLPDGRLRVVLDGLRAQDLDTKIELTGRDGTGEHVVEIEASPLSYAYAQLASDKTSDEAREAAASLYWLYKYQSDCLA